jgi:hypothetical protein
MIALRSIRHHLAMTNSYPTWDEWLAGLTEDERAKTLALRDRFAAAGADEPHLWARSEISEGIPQMARFLLLRSLWSEAINQWQQPSSIERMPAAHRLLQAGADRADITMVARAAAFETVLSVISLLDEGRPPGLDDAALPGWCLQETDNDDNPTGRRVGGLHESVLETDPSGHEAEDLWQ